MAGPVPAIHELLQRTKDVDARDKRGHDERGLRQLDYRVAMLSTDFAV
jgi:hypothetical protein